MATKSRFIAALLAVLLTSVVMCDTTLAQKKVKPDPSGPPVKYQIRLFTLPAANNTNTEVYDMNELGQVVGACCIDGQARAFLFDPSLDDEQNLIGEAIDLNDIVVNELLPGWAISAAYGINNWGCIVGSLSHPDGQSGFILDMNAEGGHQLHIIPGDILGTNLGANTWARRINDNGDVLGSYREDSVTRYYIYNPGDLPTARTVEIPTPPGYIISALSEPSLFNSGLMVAGEDDQGAFRVRLNSDNAISAESFPWEPPGSWEHNVTGGNVYSMNAAGTIGCESWITNAKKKVVYAPYLINAQGERRQLQAGSDGTRYASINSPVAINSQEDVIVRHTTSYGKRISFHHAGVHTGFEAFELNDLVVQTRSQVIGPYSDLDIWLDSHRHVSKMSDRGEIGNEPVSAIHFGQICGRIWIPSYSKVATSTDQFTFGFVLTPVKAN